MDCAFCEAKHIEDGLITKNKLAKAFPGNMPITPGHTLVVPIRHVQKLENLTNEELIAIKDLTLKITKALKKALGAKGFNYAWNEEKLAGQSVPHFHLHIVPRSEGDSGIYKYEPRKFLYRPGERPTTPEEELQKVTELIKSKL